MRDEVFRARDVDAAYQGRVVLHGVNFKLLQGEILGVFGTFDSGKTTLLDLMNGTITPLAGNVFYYGEKAERTLKSLKIAWVGRKFSLINSFTLWENMIVTNQNAKPASLLNPRYLRRMVNLFLEEYNFPQNANRRAGELTSYERFVFELLKAKFSGAEVILVDDFMLECTQEEYQALAHLLERLRREGVSFLMTSCRISLLRRFSDRLIFLYGGRIIKSVENTAFFDQDVEKLLAVMFANTSKKQLERQSGEPVLTVCELQAGLPQPVSFELRRGEILSVIDTSKKLINALCSRISLVPKSERGIIQFRGMPFRGMDVNQKRHEVVMLTPDDLYQLNESLTVVENISIGVYQRFTKFGMIRKPIYRYLKKEFDAWYGNDTLTKRLDSRNLSKQERVSVILFRMKLMNPKVIFGLNLTTDLDFITNDMLERFLNEVAEEGTAVCMLYSNIEKINDFADRYLITTREELRQNVPYHMIGHMLNWD